MRREYENKDKFPDGLIFYAPLNVEGDLSDHIQGLMPTITAKTTCEWNSTYQGYRIKPSSYASTNQGNRFTTGIIYNIDWTPIDESREFTILYEFVQYKAVVYSGSVVAANCEFIRSEANTVVLRATPPNNNWPRAVVNVMNKKMFIAATTSRVNGVHNDEHYLNGANKITSSGSYGVERFGTMRLFVGNQFDGRSSYYNDAVFKNIMVFDRVLTQDEIKKIQGIE